MSQSQPSAVIPAAPAPLWRRFSNQPGFWTPLVVVLANFALLLAWPDIAQFVLRHFATSWTWPEILHLLLQGWCLAQVPLVALWLIFGGSRALLRWPAALATIAVGVLLAFASMWGGLWTPGFFWTYYLPKWPYACLVMALLVAGLHLVLYPLRLLLRWRLDFAQQSEVQSEVRRFQFSMRDLLVLTIATAIALAVMRASYLNLARSGRSDLFFVPMVIWLMWFGQILIPTLACAWLILARKRQWIGGLVLALAIGFPLVLFYTGWYVSLSMGIGELSRIHWMNVGAVACVAINAAVLRLCGLRAYRMPPSANVT